MRRRTPRRRDQRSIVGKKARNPFSTSWSCTPCSQLLFVHRAYQRAESAGAGMSCAPTGRELDCPIVSACSKASPPSVHPGLSGTNRHPAPGITRNPAASVGGCVLMFSLLAWWLSQCQREAALPGAVSRMRVRMSEEFTARAQTSSIRRLRYFSSGGALCEHREIPDPQGYPAFSRTANSIAWYWSSRALLSSSFSLM